MESFAEDATLPLDFNASSNISRFQDMTATDSGSSHVPAGNLLDASVSDQDPSSPAHNSSMKNYATQISELKKENFSLKLRIFYMEDRMQQEFTGDHEHIFRMNIELKVECESLRKELQDKYDLLIKASNAMASIENSGFDEVCQARDEAEKELKQVKEAMSNKVQSTERELCAVRAEAEDLATNVKNLQEYVQELEEEKKEQEKRENDLISSGQPQAQEESLESNVAYPREKYSKQQEENEKLIEQLQESLQAQQSMVEALNEEKTNDNEQLLLYQNTVEELETENEEIKKELAKSESLSHKIQTEYMQHISEQQERLDEFEGAAKQMSDELEKREKEIKGISAALQDAEGMNERLTYDLEEKRKDGENQNTKDHQNTKELLMRDKAITGLTTVIQKKDDEILNLKEEIERRESNLGQLTDALDKMNDDEKLKEMREKLLEKRKFTEELQHENKELRNQLQMEGERVKSIAEDITGKEEELERLKAECAELKKEQQKDRKRAKEQEELAAKFEREKLEFSETLIKTKQKYESVAKDLEDRMLSRNLEEKIQILENQLQSKQLMLEEATSLFNKAENDRKCALAELEAAMKLREEDRKHEIDSKNRINAALSADLERLRSDLWAKEDKIQNFEIDILQLERTAHESEDMAKLYAQEVAKWKEESSRKDTIINELTKTLEELYHSFSKSDHKRIIKLLRDNDQMRHILQERELLIYDDDDSNANNRHNESLGSTASVEDISSSHRSSRTKLVLSTTDNSIQVDLDDQKRALQNAQTVMEDLKFELEKRNNELCQSKDQVYKMRVQMERNDEQKKLLERELGDKIEVLQRELEKLNLKNIAPREAEVEKKNLKQSDASSDDELQSTSDETDGVRSLSKRELSDIISNTKKKLENAEKLNEILHSQIESYSLQIQKYMAANNPELVKQLSAEVESLKEQLSRTQEELVISETSQSQKLNSVSCQADLINHLQNRLSNLDENSTQESELRKQLEASQILSSELQIQCKQLQSKLSATEETVRQQTDRLRRCQALLNAAGIEGNGVRSARSYPDLLFTETSKPNTEFLHREPQSQAMNTHTHTQTPSDATEYLLSPRSEQKFTSLIQAQAKELSALRVQLKKARNISRDLQSEVDEVTDFLNTFLSHSVDDSNDKMWVSSVNAKLDRCGHLTQRLKKQLKECTDGSDTDTDIDGDNDNARKRQFTNTQTLMLLRKDQELKEKQSQIHDLKNQMQEMNEQAFLQNSNDHKILSGLLTPTSSHHSILTTEDEISATFLQSAVSQNTEYALLPEREFSDQRNQRKSYSPRPRKSLPMYQRTIAVTEYLPSKDNDTSFSGARFRTRKNGENCSASYGGSWNTMSSTRIPKFAAGYDDEDLSHTTQTSDELETPMKFDAPCKVDASCQTDLLFEKANSNIMIEELRKKDAELRKLKNELDLNIEANSRLKNHLNLISEEMDESRDLIHSLKSELSLYEKIHSGKDSSRKNNSSKLLPSSISELLSEIKMLRVQLECTVEANRALRKQLEEKLHCATEPHDVPSCGKTTTINIHHFSPNASRNEGSLSQSDDRGKMTKDQNTSNDINLTDLLMTPPPSASSCGEDHHPLGFKFSPKSQDNNPEQYKSQNWPYYNFHGPYVLGKLSQFNELQQVVSDSRLESRNVMSRFSNKFGDKDLKGNLSVKRGLEELQKQIEDIAIYLKMFWPASIEPPPVETHRDANHASPRTHLQQVENCSESSINSEADGLRREVNKLQKRLSAQDKLLNSTVKRLQTANRMKEGIEHAILQQLTVTHKVLKKARGNLQDKADQVNNKSQESPMT